MKKDTAVIHATPRHATPRHATPRHATPRHATPRHANLIPHVASRGKFHFAHIVKPSFRSLLFLLAAGMFLFSCEKEEEIKPSSETSMTTLTLTVDSKDYAITFKDRQGTITLPYSTKRPVTAKVAAVALSAKATGVKVGDEVTIPASESFTLTITAEDKTTTQAYTVTVEKADPISEAAITSLTLTVGSTDYKIDFTDGAYTLILPAGSTLPSAVGVKQIELSSGATSDAGTKLNVTNNAVTITVTAEDKKTTQAYTVTLSVAASVGASITTLTLTVGDTDYEIMFQGTQGTMTLPYSTEIPAQVVVKEIALSDGATSVDQGTQLSVTDNAVTITVTAEDDKTTSMYTVTLSVAANSEASITTLILTVEDTDYEIMFEDMQGTMRLPYSTEIPAQVEVKEIALSPGATSVDQGTQLSVTDNAITITVTAEDGETTQAYTVRLTVSVVITSFTFEVPDNESMALDTANRKRIVGKIDQEAKTITFDRQSAYVYRDKLKATFEVSEAGAAVQVAGADQTSGTTEQDFSVPVAYAVRAQGGMETTYRVTLTKSTLATIPDEIFRALLKSYVPAAFTGDELDITHSAVTNHSGIAVSNETPKLTSLKGIEFFTALDTLSCSVNSLTSLDVSKNTALTELRCDGNGLTSLDVRANTALEVLYCGDNDLASLDVSGTTALTELSCGYNDLASLDVRANTALTSLSCSGNNSLASLDVRANTALTKLICSKNSLQSLDVSGSTSLTELDCFGNALTSLDMTGMRSVTRLNIGLGTAENNPLATLRVNTAVQDNNVIITMKRIRGVGLTITTVDNDGEVVCTNYAPANPGTCNTP